MPVALMNPHYAPEIYRPMPPDIDYAQNLYGPAFTEPEPEPEPTPTPPVPGAPDMGGLRAILELLRSLSTFISGEQFTAFVQVIRDLIDAWRAQQTQASQASTQIAPERQAVLDELEAEIAKLESCG